MDDDELRAAMRTTMTITPPPPMESAAAVAAGHRAVRRRAAWAGAGLTAVLVAATSVAVGAGLGAGLGRPAGPPWPAASPASASFPPTDAEVSAHQAKSRELISPLERAVPSGWTTGPDPSLPGQIGLMPAADGTGTSWRYVAAVSVSRQGRIGELRVWVYTPGNGEPADLCRLASRVVGSTPSACTLVPVGPAKVAVLGGKSADGLTDQAAAYRYPDGTVVCLVQSRQAGVGHSEGKPLAALPLTVPELAARATDLRFHLS
jgi:hypothetical protein